MARKLFYNKRRKLPAFLQLYLAWFIIAAISLSLFYYFGVVKLKNSKPKLVALKNGPASYFGQQVRNQAKNWFKKKGRVAAVRKAISRSFSTNMNGFFKNYSYENSLCNGFYLSPKQPNQNQFLIISEWKASLGRENTQVVLALTQFLSQSNSNAASLLLVDNIEDCDFTELPEEINANAAGIIIVKEFHHNKSSIVLGTNKITSIQLSPYLIKADTSITKQVSASVYGALRFNSLSNSKVIANFKSSKTALKDLAPKLTGLISSLNPKDTESASFWVSSTRQLSSSFVITLYILFAIFIWLTYLNVTYKNQERLQIVEGIIATVYFSSVPLVLYFSSSLLSKFIDDFDLWLTLTIILLGGLLWLIAYFKGALSTLNVNSQNIKHFIKYLKEALFKLHVNLPTAILVYNSILLFIALKSASLFILIALTPQFFSMARRSHIIVSIILSAIALIPLIYITVTGFSAIQTNLPIHQYFFTNLNASFFQIVLIALGIGSVISLLNKSKSKEQSISSNNEETTILQNIIHSNDNLTSHEKLSLEAYLMSKLKDDDKEVMRKMIIDVALSDGRIDPSEVKEIEKLYTTLGLDKSTVPADMHALSSSRKGSVNKVGSVLTRPSKKQTFSLDESILNARETETKAAQNLLKSIFKNEDEADNEKNLDTKLEASRENKALAIYKIISDKEKIERSEFEKICSEHGFFVNAAIDSINEWAYDKVNAPVLEDETDIMIDREIAGELKELENVQ